jgi:hypothetical protein
MTMTRRESEFSFIPVLIGSGAGPFRPVPDRAKWIMHPLAHGLPPTNSARLGQPLSSTRRR